ncbi:MAG: phosphoribosylaminoimidazolesuccinocarboxamide synthase [Alkalinema sp. CACIAM 70d]|nr:MAG: phosphoribosylaminoimidazolesuccinocarboxamide synthase [Alkalinema sp. CACIAM 70d]
MASPIDDTRENAPAEIKLGEKLYEGKAKILYATDDPDQLLTFFKDDATAFNAQKKGSIRGKGEINNAISAHLFKLMASKGVPTHFISLPHLTQMLVKAVTIIPLEVVVRNIAAGSLCKQTGLALGTEIQPPLVEFYLKDDALGDPLLTPDRLRLLNLATPEEVETLTRMALTINDVLRDFFNQCEITLVDFKLEFGRDRTGQILLADEISPDTCRLWKQGEPDPQKRVLDKDRFRQDLGDVEGGYRQVLERVLGQAV